MESEENSLKVEMRPEVIQVSSDELLCLTTLYSRLLRICRGECGKETEDAPLPSSDSRFRLTSERGMWGNPGGRPNTVRATKEPAEVNKEVGSVQVTVLVDFSNIQIR